MNPRPLILVAHDADSPVTDLVSALAKFGAQPVVLATLEVVDKLREIQPDLFVVALRNPQPVAHLVEQSFKASPTLPAPLLVVCCAEDAVEAHAQALEAGADNFLHFDAPERQFTAVIASLLRRSKYRRRVVQEAESRFVRIFENAAVGIAQLKPDGAWLRVNQRLCQILGYSSEELLQTTFQELTYPPDLQMDLDLLARLLRGQIESYRLEKRYVHKDGYLVWANLSVGIERRDDGTPKYLVSVVEEISDRKVAERLRSLAEERLTAALRASSTGTFRWDVKEDSLFWDESLKKIFGFPSHYPIRRVEDFTNRLHPDDRGPVFLALEKCRQDGSDFDLEFRILWPDGTVRWLSDRGRMFLDADGNPDYMTGACLDITARKGERDERQANEESLRMALRSANAGSFDWDIVNGVVGWSTELEVLYGLEPGTFPGTIEAFRASLHPDDRKLGDEAIEQGFKTGEVSGQWRLVRPNGEIRWVSAAGKVYYNFNGDPVRMLGVNIDITAQKTAERALRERAQIIDQIHDAIMTADMNACITTWNRGAERLFGYTFEQVRGKPVTVLHARDEQEKLLADAWKNIYETGIFEREARLRRKSGELFDAHLSIVAVRDERDEMIGTIGYVTDVTERKRTEQALRVSEKLAATGRLASTLAHEINNPLASVTNLMFLLRQHASLDPQARSYVALAEGELSRVTHITRNLLSFHRGNREPQHIDVAALVDNVLELYEAKFRSRGTVVVRKYRDPAFVTAFAGELKQVLSNLIENAMDAAGENSRLQITIKQVSHDGDREVQVSVADNGKGIDREHLRQLFEPFFTTKGEKGTGLGLWVTKDIVNKQGGRIRVRSRKGAGAVFSIVLPYEAAAQAQGSAD